MQTFATFTTKRLNVVRTANGKDTSLKKKDVTQEMVSKFFES